MTHKEEILRLMRETGEINWCPFENSKIAEFFKNQNIFVTGATGFLGKLLVEKLLRACPEIQNIYILVRKKKQEDEHHRVDKLYSEPIYGPLTKLQPKFQHKITILKGDISLPNLGLSETSISLIQQEINIIFHVAATVRFDETITVATQINVRATRDLLEIAKQCKNLKSFVHVSTAFANCIQKEIDEIFYKTPVTADELIEMIETQPEEKLVEDTPKILQDWPNTYTFTKAVAEEAVASHGKGLPVCIVRPAIVVATYKEPLRSWIDNVYGATGIVVGAGIGLLKTVYCDGKKSAELVPGDYVINSIIAASYQTAKDKNMKIYNYVSSAENRLTWYRLMENCQKWGIEIPTIRCVWYYSLTLNNYYYIHVLYTIFFHFLPAILIDFGMILARQKPIMIKIYKKIVKFESIVSHFCSTEWKFYNQNTQNLWKQLEDSDQKMFPFSMSEFSWEEFHKTHLLGLRTYIVKDDISTLPQAEVKWRRFYFAHQFVKFLIYFLIIYGFYWILSKFI